jgi:hypothetical protein
MGCSVKDNYVIKYPYEDKKCSNDLFDIVDKTTEENRIAICKQCPGNINLYGSNNCIACECFVATIVKSNKRKCPIGLW